MAAISQARCSRAGSGPPPGPAPCWPPGPAFASTPSGLEGRLADTHRSIVVAAAEPRQWQRLPICAKILPWLKAAPGRRPAARSRRRLRRRHPAAAARLGRACRRQPLLRRRRRRAHRRAGAHRRRATRWCPTLTRRRWPRRTPSSSRHPHAGPPARGCCSAPSTRRRCRAIRPGTRLVSICTGAFVLAATGVLDGRPATTHWAYADAFRRLYPRVRLDEKLLFVDDGDVLTSAGLAAGVDLCLHIIRRDHGVAVANHVARRTVVPPWRAGRPGAVHRAAGARQRRGDDGRRAGLGDCAPRRPHRRRAARPERPDERADVQPALPRGDRPVTRGAG